jgi:hypothetical protein
MFGSGAREFRVDDLGTQLEDLLVFVFKCEEEARLDDRIDLSLKLRPQQS